MSIVRLIGGDHPSRPIHYEEVGRDPRIPTRPNPILLSSGSSWNGFLFSLFIVLASVAALLFVIVINIANNPALAQAVTPAPWLSVAGPFPFCYSYPGMMGCKMAEDKTDDPFVHGWKHDVDRARADCLHWAVVGTFPTAQLSLDTACSGGAKLTGGIYWFDAPIVVTPPPPTPAATFTPFPSPPATGTPTPLPTSGTGTPAPSPTWTMAPITTPIIITFTATPTGSQPVCNSVLNIYGVDPRVQWGNVPSVHYTGEGGDCGTIVVLMEKSDVVTFTHELLDSGLINALIKEMVIRCLRDVATCEDLNGLPIPIPATPEPGGQP